MREVLDHLLAVRENSELIFNLKVFEGHPHLNLIEELVLNIDDLTFLLIVCENSFFVHRFQEGDEIGVLAGEGILSVDPLWIDSVIEFEGQTIELNCILCEQIGGLLLVFITKSEIKIAFILLNLLYWLFIIIIRFNNFFIPRSFWF